MLHASYLHVVTVSLGLAAACRSDVTTSAALSNLAIRDAVLTDASLSDASVIQDAAPFMDAQSAGNFPGAEVTPVFIQPPSPMPPPTMESRVNEWSAQSYAVAVVICTSVSYQPIDRYPYATTTFALNSKQQLRGTSPPSVTINGGVLSDHVSYHFSDFEMTPGVPYLAFFEKVSSGTVINPLLSMIDDTHVWVVDGSYVLDDVAVVVNNSPSPVTQ